MKTLITAFLFFAFSFSGISQISSSFDLNFGVGYSTKTNSYFDHLKESDGDYLFTTEHIGRMSWRFGLSIDEPISDKFFVKSGILISRIGFTEPYVYNEKTAGGWCGTVSPPSPPSDPKKYDKLIDHLFLEWALAGRYEFTGRKFTPFIEGGISPYFHLATKERYRSTPPDKTEWGKTSSFKKVHFVTNISVGVNYTVNSHLQAYAQPIFRYHFAKLKDHNYFDHPYDIGMEIGIRLKRK